MDRHDVIEIRAAFDRLARAIPNDDSGETVAALCGLEMLIDDIEIKYGSEIIN